MKHKFRFHKFQRMALSCFVSWALSFYIIGHRLIEYSNGQPFIPPTFIFKKWLFFVCIVGLQLATFFIVLGLLKNYEKVFQKLFNKRDALAELGWHAFKYSFILAAIEFIFAGVVTIIDVSLLNV